MLIEPTFLEALLAQRPDVEKKIKKDYKISKKNLKERLDMLESDELRIQVLEEDMTNLERRFNDSEIKFMIQVLNIPFSEVNLPHGYKYNFNENINFPYEKTISSFGHKSSPHYVSDFLGYKNRTSTLYEIFIKEFPSFAKKAHQLKKPKDFFKTVADMKYGQLYSVFLSKKLTFYKNTISKKSNINEDEIIKLRKPERTSKDKRTIFGTTETALFARYLRTAHVILSPQNGLTDTDVAKAFQILTNFSYNKIRLDIGGDSSMKFKKADYLKIRSVLQGILEQVEKDSVKLKD